MAALQVAVLATLGALADLWLLQADEGQSESSTCTSLPPSMVPELIVNKKVGSSRVGLSPECQSAGAATFDL